MALDAPPRSRPCYAAARALVAREGSHERMSKLVISTPDAPRAIGPYSQAIASVDLVFLSGQIALDPSTGELIEGDVEAQTRQVLANMSAVLSAAGASFERIVKTTIFLVDLGDFQRVNAIYAECFTGAPPARSTVQVSRLPRNALVEIEAIATLAAGQTERP